MAGSSAHRRIGRSDGRSVCSLGPSVSPLASYRSVSRSIGQKVSLSVVRSWMGMIICQDGSWHDDTDETAAKALLLLSFPRWQMTGSGLSGLVYIG